MQLTVTTRHIDQNKSEDLKNYISKKIKKLERYIGSTRNPCEVKAVLTVEKFRNTAEILVNSGGSLKSTSSVEAEDMYVAIDGAIDSTIKQLKRKTEKRIETKRSIGARSTPQIEPQALTLRSEEDGEDIKVERAPSKPMSVEEAVLQLKVSDMDFLVFRNSETGEVNVVYKKKGNSIGLIAPGR
ncbi:MAG: ribosome hibernation-promoting factor, HPF/YfiA family [Ignavibacteriales bacterium]